MEKSVVIVGGGFAGLAAAKTLQEAGVSKVTLLEATQKFGGRAKSVQLPDGNKAELGATWLHGINGHPVYDLAITYGLMSPNLKKGTNFWHGSQLIREGETEKLGKEESDLASHVISHFAKSVDGSGEAGLAVIGDYLRQEFAQFTQQWERGSRAAQIVSDAWGWREQLQRGIDGTDSTDDGNTEASAAYDDLPGPWPPVTGGYQTVAEKMAEGLEDARLSVPVTEIDWADDVVTVTCKSGETLQADAVVLTCSLGVLKDRHASLFKPPLPGEKVGAIQRLGMGVVDKIFVTFEGLQVNTSRRYEFLWKQRLDDYLPVDAGTSFKRSTSAIDACINDTEESCEAEPWYTGIFSLRLGGDEIIRHSKDLHEPGEGTEAPPKSTRREHKQQDHNSCTAAESSAAGNPIASGTIWISGHHAAEMEKCSDEEVAEGINALLDAFPAIDLPRNFKVE